jgi:hypothetical protein
MRGRLAYELIACKLKLFVRCPVFENGKLARDPELVPGTVSSPPTSTARKYVAYLGGRTERVSYGRICPIELQGVVRKCILRNRDSRRLNLPSMDAPKRTVGTGTIIC